MPSYIISGKFYKIANVIESVDNEGKVKYSYNQVPVKDGMVEFTLKGGDTDLRVVVEPNDEGNYRLLVGEDISFPSDVSIRYHRDNAAGSWGSLGGFVWDGGNLEYDVRIPDDGSESSGATGAEGGLSQESFESLYGSAISASTADVYYSGNQCTVSVMGVGGSVWEELDIATINFTIQDTKIPLYGYKSTFFDGVASGNVIVQGSLALNMKTAFELNKYLKRTYQGVDSKYRMFGGRNYRLRKTDEWINQEQPQINAYEATVPVRFDINVWYQFDYSYNVTNVTGYRIESAQITSIGQAASYSGEPIGENYNFLARNITPIRRKLQ